MKLNIQLALPEDLAAATDFLISNRLTAADLSENNVQLFLAYDDNELVATIGLEKHGSTGLLRSLAVKEAFRNQQLADKMIKGLIAVCQSEGIREIYLLTNTAETYFIKKGFLPVKRDRVPHVIQQTREFRNICPSSAVVMRKRVKKKVLKK